MAAGGIAMAGEGLAGLKHAHGCEHYPIQCSRSLSPCMIESSRVHA